jgi:hypothetical protein
MNESAIIAIVGAIAGVIAGFFKLIDKQNKLHEKLSLSIDRMAMSGDRQAEKMGEVARATTKAALEAEQRNGHLAEITIQQGDRIEQLVMNVKEQHVEHQHVERETVEDKK